MIFFSRKEADLCAFFLLFTASVGSWPPGITLVHGVLFFLSPSFAFDPLRGNSRGVRSRPPGPPLVPGVLVS